MEFIKNKFDLNENPYKYDYVTYPTEEWMLDGGEIELKINFDKNREFINNIHISTWAGGWGHMQTRLHIEKHSEDKWACTLMLPAKNNINLEIYTSDIYNKIIEFYKLTFPEELRDKQLNSIGI